MKNNKGLAAVLLVVCCFMTVALSIGAYDDYQVYSKGTLVDAVVTNHEDSLGFVRFTVGGKQYDKRVDKPAGNGVYKYYAGQALRLKYLKGYEDNFLFADENPLSVSVNVLFFLLLCITFFAQDLAIRKK